MSTSQYAGQHKPKDHLTALTCVFVAAGFLLSGKNGFALIGCLVGYGFALRRAYKSLDGMNGDISGYMLTASEMLDFAKNIFAITDSEVFTCTAEAIEFSKRCINHLEEFIFSNPDPVFNFRERQSEWERKTERGDRKLAVCASIWREKQTLSTGFSANWSRD